MHWEIDDRAELTVDVAAAAIFAAAVGFALWATALGVGTVAVATAATFLAAQSGLRRISPGERTFALPAFPLGPIEPIEAQGEAAEELILEDELIEVGPHARVVRLFGSGQSRHHPSNHSKPAPPDASQALSEALAELRRSMH